MLLCRTLRLAQNHYVNFDPQNTEHLKAFQLLCLGTECAGAAVTRQHKTLRFELEGNFQDVRSMMFYKVGQAYLATR